MFTLTGKKDCLDESVVKNILIFPGFLVFLGKTIFLTAFVFLDFECYPSFIRFFIIAKKLGFLLNFSTVSVISQYYSLFQRDPLKIHHLMSFSHLKF